MSITTTTLPDTVSATQLLPRQYAYAAALFDILPIGIGQSAPLVATADHTVFHGDPDTAARAAANQAVQALARGHVLHHLNLTQPSPVDALHPFTTAHCTDAPTAIAELRHLTGELTRRTGLLQEHGVFSVDRLPNSVRMGAAPVSPVCVVIEGISRLLLDAQATDLLDELLRRGRHLGIHLVIPTDTPLPARLDTQFSNRIVLLDEIDTELLELTSSYDGLPKDPADFTGPGLAYTEITGVPTLYRQALTTAADLEELPGLLRTLGVPTPAGHTCQ